MDSEIQLHQIHANGIDFSYLACGSGPIALCVHGFPDSAHTWRYLMPELVRAGFRAIAPFTRGYAPTSVAPDDCYQTGARAADINALHEALGGDENAVLIGHDWGASTVMTAAANAPHRWKRVVAMSVPPVSILRKALTGNHAQIKRSWYMFYFQSALAEIAIEANDYQFIEMLWDDWSPGFKSNIDLENFKKCVPTASHLKAALGYYRASLGNGKKIDIYSALETQGLEPLTQPTLYLHGKKDGCIGVELAEETRRTCPWLEVRILDQVGHFMQLEDPRQVNQHIVEWLT